MAERSSSPGRTGIAAAIEPARGLAALTHELNAWIEVDVEALAANIAALRVQFGAEVELIPVVKANAYGHGAVGVTRELERLGVTRVAVVWKSEGLELRRAGLRLPILVLGHSYPGDAAEAVAADLTLTCHSAALGAAVARAAWESGRTAKVHIKVDTGLHRFGVDPEEGVALAEHLRRFPGLQVEGVSTHMANADEEDDSFSEAQQEAFEAVLRELDWIPLRHAGNSATALRRPDLRHNAVRCGLAVYGVAPPNTPDPGLQPILSLHARVARVVNVPVGDGVSYGLAWRAIRPTRAALVPVGYADGWRRSLGRRGAVLVAGTRCPIIGRVAMDQFLVDVTDLPDVEEGDQVTLLGRQGQEAITVDEVADWADTISWEILAGLQTRVPRLYHRNGVVGGPADLGRL